MIDYRVWRRLGGSGGAYGGAGALIAGGLPPTHRRPTLVTLRPQPRLSK
jgi:hypothetical protein